MPIPGLVGAFAIIYGVGAYALLLAALSQLGSLPN